MPKPPPPLIAQWRDLAQEGLFYTDIAKDYPDYTVSQIRRYCLGEALVHGSGLRTDPPSSGEDHATR